MLFVALFSSLHSHTFLFIIQTCWYFPEVVSSVSTCNEALCMACSDLQMWSGKPPTTMDIFPRPTERHRVHRLKRRAQSAWTKLECYLRNNVPWGDASALREAQRKVSVCHLPPPPLHLLCTTWAVPKVVFGPHLFMSCDFICIAASKDLGLHKAQAALAHYTIANLHVQSLLYSSSPGLSPSCLAACP